MEYWGVLINFKVFGAKQSKAQHRDHFVYHPSVCLSICHTLLLLAPHVEHWWKGFILIFDISFRPDCEDKPVYEMEMAVYLHQQFGLATAFMSIVGKLLMITLSNFACIYTLMSIIHCIPCPWPVTNPVSRSIVGKLLMMTLSNFICIYIHFDEHYPLRSLPFLPWPSTFPVSCQIWRKVFSTGYRHS